MYNHTHTHINLVGQEQGYKKKQLPCFYIKQYGNICSAASTLAVLDLQQQCLTWNLVRLGNNNVPSNLYLWCA